MHLFEERHRLCYDLTAEAIRQSTIERRFCVWFCHLGR